MSENPTNKLFSGRSSTFLALMGASILSCCLLLIRMKISGSIHFAFLTWNLFLAWVPWWISWVLTQRKWSLIVLMPGLALWMLFFPNAPYIVTDLFHLFRGKGIPAWMDLCVIFSFAWTGLMLAFDSLRMIQSHIFDRLGNWTRYVFTPLIMLLSAYGVYLGRYERWNSWDLAVNPIELLQAVSSPLLNPASNERAIGFTLLFAGVLLVIYVSLWGWRKQPGHENVKMR